MKRRTTITLTLVGLLATAGIVYAATAIPFASFGPPGQPPGPLGVAAAPTDLFVSEYCTANGGTASFANIDRIDCMGNVSVYATIPSIPGCYERYMAITPLAAAQANPPWTPRDVFIADGNNIYKVTAGSTTLFATLQFCPSDHTSLTFDHVGTFGHNMIATCKNGIVWTINANGTVTPLADTGTEIEGPAVVPPGFGTYGGQIWVADEVSGQVHAVAPNGTVTHGVINFVGAEAVNVIPAVPCTFCSGGAFFQSITNFNTLYKYLPTDFAGLGGNVIVTSEEGIGSILVTWDGTKYNQSFFDNIVGGGYEGSSFVDCDVPTPTPTPTPTATFTPTPTATATATATFTPTATATATFTPTPTATFTPTPTPTPTMTPTTCGSSFVIGDLDAVVGHKVTFWGAQWWRLNHLSGGRAPASFKGFANCTNQNPPACGGTWQSDPGNSLGPPRSVPADIIVIVSSLITKSGPIISGDVPMMVIVHTDPGYKPDPGHEGTGTVTAVVCGSAPRHQPPRPNR